MKISSMNLYQVKAFKEDVKKLSFNYEQMEITGDNSVAHDIKFVGLNI